MNMALVQAMITASFYGITDEFHQSFIPGRCMSITDWAADTVGAVIGSSIMLLIFSVKENIHPRSENEQETDSNTQ
jgi:VanZ family protein